MKKCYLLAALGAMFFSQAQDTFAQSTCTVKYNEGQGMIMTTKMSDNGLYVSGVESIFSGYLWNVRTGEMTYWQPQSESSIDDPSVICWDITDNGMVVGANVSDPGTCMNNTWTKVNMPQPKTGKKHNMGEILSVTPSGDKMVGPTYWKSADGKQSTSKLPCLWTNGEPQLLDTISYDDTGRRVQFNQAERISADGSVITGFVCAYNGQYGFGVIWRAPEYKVEPLFYDSLKTEKWMGYSIKEVSPNGKWLAGIALVPEQELEGGIISCIVRLIRYNLETNELDMVMDLEDIDAGFGEGGPTFVDNNGTIYSSTSPQAASNPWARDCNISRVGKPSISLKDYLIEMGESEFNEKMYYAGGITGVAADGKSLVGHGAMLDEDGSTFNYTAYLIEIDGGSGINTEKNNNLACFAEGKVLRLVGEPTNIEVINMAGGVVYNASVTSSTVSLANLSNGIYAVKLTDGKEVKTQKIVIK